MILANPNSDRAESGVVCADACDGAQISRDGSRVRLEFSSGTKNWALELPVGGLASLMKVLAETQQRALPRASGNPALRVVRRPVTWSLERDMADDTLALVLVTADGFEWCFSLADAEVFRMAKCLGEERAVTLPASDCRQ